MSIDIANRIIRCDTEGCPSTTDVPIRIRQYYDKDVLELRGESSASGWVFMSSGRFDKHYCPVCGEKHISPSRQEQTPCRPRC